MIEIVSTVLTVLSILFFLNKRMEARQAARDAQFEAIMRSLEEKAKREGTFKVSYFTKEDK